MRTPEFGSAPAIWVVCPRAPGVKILFLALTQNRVCASSLLDLGRSERNPHGASHGCQLGLCCSTHWGMHLPINLIWRKMGMFTHKCSRKGFSIGIAERHQTVRAFCAGLFYNCFARVCKIRGISAEPPIHTPKNPDNHFSHQNKSIFISVPLSICTNVLIFSLYLLFPTPFLLLSLLHR